MQTTSAPLRDPHFFSSIKDWRGSGLRGQRQQQEQAAGRPVHRRRVPAFRAAFAWPLPNLLFFTLFYPPPAGFCVGSR